jgi:hypothetical protein
MLSAADRLIPRVQPQEATAWGWGTRPQKAELLARARSDFCTTRSGRVLDALIQAFSQTRMFKNSWRFSFDEWMELLDLYYQCARYVLPFPRPSFVPDILRFAASEPNHSAVKAIALVAHYEPWIAKQVTEREHIEELTQISHRE